MERLSKKKRFEKVLAWFEENNPLAETELEYTNPYELIVAVILSAQCTDVRVNMITPAFYQIFPNEKALANATQDEVFELIKSCSYPNNKAKNLIGMAKTLISEFNGVVPDDVDELQKLPGVGRKTANVIASVVFKKPAMAVDTHVFRVAARIGLTTNAKTPLATEKQLVQFIPEEKIHVAHHWLILHGRYVCKARKPMCDSCGITSFCKFFKKQNS
ncbi:MAG TPA: endonuclease III [Bacteroidales bacterium]|nr:endonuclease III [Bacteroidales bacterium]HRX98224.1 endonuclease III [Bacteroidales bacterium]